MAGPMRRTEVKSRRASKRQMRSEFPTDSLWRDAVIEWLGSWCLVPDCMETNVQIDHIIPRAQGGLSDLHNGWSLCVNHHDAKTASELKINPEWLRPEHIDYLAARGWVEWTIDDTRVRDLPNRVFTPTGHGYRHFTVMTLSGDDIV